MQFTRGMLYTKLDEDTGMVQVRHAVSDEIVMELSLAAAEDLAETMAMRADEGRELVAGNRGHVGPPAPRKFILPNSSTREETLPDHIEWHKSRGQNVCHCRIAGPA